MSSEDGSGQNLLGQAEFRNSDKVRIGSQYSKQVLVKELSPNLWWKIQWKTFLQLSVRGQEWDIFLRDIVIKIKLTSIIHDVRIQAYAPHAAR